MIQFDEGYIDSDTPEDRGSNKFVFWFCVILALVLAGMLGLIFYHASGPFNCGLCIP